MSWPSCLTSGTECSVRLLTLSEIQNEVASVERHPMRNMKSKEVGEYEILMRCPSI
jgi:hypothetical protein